MTHYATFPWLLSFIIWVPFAGALVVMFIPRDRPEVCRAIGLVVTLVEFALAIWLLVAYQAHFAPLQFVEKYSWIPGIGASYSLGVDGISIFMILLNGLLFPLMIIGSEEIHDRVKHFIIMLLAVEGATMGVFTAIDMFLFFAFWEASLVPMYFLIGYWGHGRKVYAALKFFIFTAAGSAFLFAAIIGAGILAKNGPNFDAVSILNTTYSIWTQRLLFWGFTIAFLVKVPVVPVHTWLPDAHTMAPTAGSVDLAGILLKMGTYGLLRFAFPLFPQAAVEAGPVLLTLGVVGIIWGAMAAIRQSDVKRLVAYTSVSHLGFVVMGIGAITTAGMSGGVLQMLNHGVSTGALFFMVGFLYDRLHTREISEFGGLKRSMPVFAALFLITALAAAGLPGLNGFVGEALTLFGTFVVHKWWAMVAAVGVILAAVYILWLYQRMFHGPIKEAHKALRDLKPVELVILVPLIAVMFFLGIYPKPALDRITPSVDNIIAQVEIKTTGTAQQYRQPWQTANLASQIAVYRQVVNQLYPKGNDALLNQITSDLRARATRQSQGGK